MWHVESIWTSAKCELAYGLNRAESFGQIEPQIQIDKKPTHSEKYRPDCGSRIRIWSRALRHLDISTQTYLSDTKVTRISNNSWRLNHTESPCPFLLSKISVCEATIKCFQFLKNLRCRWSYCLHDCRRNFSQCAEFSWTFITRYLYLQNLFGYSPYEF